MHICDPFMCIISSIKGTDLIQLVTQNLKVPNRRHVPYKFGYVHTICLCQTVHWLLPINRSLITDSKQQPCNFLTF